LTEGNYDGARTILTGLMAGDQSNADANLVLGMVEDVSGRYEAAVKHYRRVLDVDSGNFIALNNLAYRLANQGGAADEALKLAQQAKELAPQNPAVDDTLGWAYYQKGLYKNAVTHLESSISSVAAPVRLYHLAMAYAKVGQIQKADRALKAALQSAPGLPEAKAAQETVWGSQLK
jgi:Flp pilus assembly protein TadD